MSDEKRFKLAWNLTSESKHEGPRQPWREVWPPKSISDFTDEELQNKPWLTWKRDPRKLNDKPWYTWVNEFEGEVDTPCERIDCPNCFGQGPLGPKGGSCEYCWCSSCEGQEYGCVIRIYTMTE